MLDDDETPFALDDDGWFTNSPRWNAQCGEPIESPSPSIQTADVPTIFPPDVLNALARDPNYPPNTTFVETTAARGMEASAVQALNILQRKGHVQFKELIAELGIDHRRGYDLCNVLLTTPLINKQGPRKENNQPFVWCNPRTTDDPINISRLGQEVIEHRRLLEQKQEYVRRLRERMNRM